MSRNYYKLMFLDKLINSLMNERDKILNSDNVFIREVRNINNKRIIKLSKEVNVKKQFKKELHKCPECGYENNIGMYHYETSGLFKTKFKYTHNVNCFKCECEYQYETNKL